MAIKIPPKLLTLSAISILIVLTGFFIFKYWQTSKELAALKTDPTKLTALLESENKKILNRLSGLIQLPEETPRIVTITDKASIASEPLLAKAETGDAFIIFSTAKKAILYRPSQNKIIDVIPISAPVPTPATTITPTPTKKI